MNRILFERSEFGDGGHVCLDGRRAAHICKVLKPAAGDRLRVGILDGPRGVGEVLSVADGHVDLACVFETEAPEAPRIDLLLALPRPKVMRRLWAVLASMGVGRIVLTNAEKVERNYFDTHWLNEDTYRPLLIEGVEQSGDTRIPEVTICRRLKPLLEDSLEDMFPGYSRLICHPDSFANASVIGENELSKDGRVLLAVGPEGGWTDYEVDMFAQHGFDCISMGWRTLRTDVACVALIAAVRTVMGG